MHLDYTQNSLSSVPLNLNINAASKLMISAGEVIILIDLPQVLL